MLCVCGVCVRVCPCVCVCVCVSYTQVVEVLSDVVRDTLTVVAQASLAVRNHADIRDLAQQMYGNTAAAAAITRDTLAGTRAAAGRAGSVGDSARLAVTVGGAGKTAALLRQLRDMLGIEDLQVCVYVFKISH